MGERATRRRILEETIDVIEQRGEAAVRVVDVAHRAGVTQGMVTYHFGTRTNLVVEAQRERFAAATGEDLTTAVAALDRMVDRESALAVARAITTTLFDPERVARRRSRLNALGYAAGDATLWEALRERSTELTDGFTAVFTELGRRGLLREGVTPRAAATMTMAYSFGLVLSGLDDTPPSAAELSAVIDGFTSSLLAD